MFYKIIFIYINFNLVKFSMDSGIVPFKLFLFIYLLIQHINLNEHIYISKNYYNKINLNVL